MTPKARRLSIYISPKDTEVLRWIEEQTRDGTSESDALLRLVRKELRAEPSPVESELRATIARLEGLIERALRQMPAQTEGTGAAAGGALPPDSFAGLATENWNDWK